MPAGEAWNSRTERLLGGEATERLARSRVLVVGVGGVGGYAAEVLARSGVGDITIVDADCVAATNINRQLIADTQTVGQPKTDLFEARFRAINPDISVTPVCSFVTPENVGSLLEPGYDIVIDAIDTVAPKTALLEECLKRGIPVLTSMGAGGRLDPTKVGYFDLCDTEGDGLARAVRQRLRKRGLRRGLTAVASTELPKRHSIVPLEERNKRSSFGTLATIPAIFGIMLANRAILHLTGFEPLKKPFFRPEPQKNA